MTIDPIFNKYLSSTQIKNLSQIGINSVYSLLIYLPYSLENLLPIKSFFGSKAVNTEDVNIKTKYLMQAKLINFTRNQGKTGQSYFYLCFSDDAYNINTYYFMNSNFVAKTLIIGQSYQLILTNNNNLWSLEKMSIAKDDLTDDIFKLGNAKIQKYLLPRYSKSGFLQSGFFSQIYLQIPRQFFQLNLTELVPENNIIPQTIDFWDIHHPQSNQKYQSTLQQWISLRVFLKLTLMKFLEQNEEKKYAKSSNIDLDYLKLLSNNLPFELSISQKNAIWSILKELKTD